MKILMTGGSGKLGSAILKIRPDIVAPDSLEMNLLDILGINNAIERYEPDMILHVAASTLTKEMEDNPQIGIQNNILGTTNIAMSAWKYQKRLVYISTDYVYHGKGPHSEDEPVLPSYNYGWSKLGGECAVRMLKDSLIIRLSFGPTPFPYDYVYEQITSKLYVDEAAELVLKVADSDEVGVINLGRQSRTLYDYAKETNPKVQIGVTPAWSPRDTSLDLTKLEKFNERHK